MANVDAITNVMSREDRPAWVRFETVAVENQKETLKQGKWVGTDIEFVYITSPYTKDEHPKKVSSWFEQLRLQVIQGRISQQRLDYYQSQYDAWKKGQEMPLEGTPIKGWGMISPAQQQTLISCRVRTVEDLACINDEGIRQVGMGGVDMKQKANAWLAQNKDKGPLTVEMAAVKAENRELNIKVETLSKQVEELMRQAKVAAYTLPTESRELAPTRQIEAADLVPEEEDHLEAVAPPKRPRGNPNWVKKGTDPS